MVIENEHQSPSAYNTRPSPCLHFLKCTMRRIRHNIAFFTAQERTKPRGEPIVSQTLRARIVHGSQQLHVQLLADTHFERIRINGAHQIHQVLFGAAPQGRYDGQSKRMRGYK